jgi:hypothetical protein
MAEDRRMTAEEVVNDLLQTEHADVVRGAVAWPRGSNGPRTHDKASTPSVDRPAMQPGAIRGAPVRVDRRRSDVAGNASVRTVAPTAAAQHPSAFQGVQNGRCRGE